MPFLNQDDHDKDMDEDIRNILNVADIPLPGKEIPLVQPTQPMASLTSSSSSSGSSEVQVKLPPNWRTARDREGRLYYYNRKTKEVSWEPPAESDSDSSDIVIISEKIMEIETASDNDEINPEEEDGEDTDDEDEDDSDKEGDDMEAVPPVLKSSSNIFSSVPKISSNEDTTSVVSDLSEAEKENLLRSNRKKSKEERHHERRQKREQNREKREYERKRRRERHGKHRRDGLVQEHLIPHRTDKDKADLMTFEEMRIRLANKDAIREKQEEEERAEEERDHEVAQRQRREAAQERRRQVHLSEEAEVTPNKSKEATTEDSSENDTEAERKIKALFLKETSKVVVKNLEEHRAVIKSKDDFKHLAKKLTHMTMAGELKNGRRIEELKCNDRVKKKTADFVRKYMAKYEQD